MIYRVLKATVFTVAALLPCAVTFAADIRARPNVLIILADDLGYGDVQCYNPQRGKIPTPNIDKLATQGMRFTDAHTSSGVCTPTRYSLLTGRYHWRTRLQSGVLGGFSKPLIAKDRLTLAGLLKQNGYHTACIGKWHLGMTWPLKNGQIADDKGDFGKPFADLDITRQSAICDDICHPGKARPEFKKAASFFMKFRSLSAAGYYSTQEGWKAIGFVGNVPTATFDGPPPEVLRQLSVEQTVK